VQRFFLYLLPIFKLAEAVDADNTKTLFVKFCDLLINGDFSIASKTTSLLHMFNNVTTNHGMKAYTYEQLVLLCLKEGCLDIIVEQARNIDAESRQWNLTQEERNSLLKTVATVLDGEKDVGAFKVMQAYLRQFQKATDSQIATTEREASRCVVLAIKTHDVINIEEVLDLRAVKQLQSKNKDLFAFLNLFTNTDAKDFKQQLSKFSKLMENEGLQADEILVKKSYVQICSLSTENSNFKYTELSQLLNIDEEEVEEWAITAIANGIIDAKID